MKAILVREFGAPEVLKLEEVPTPTPGLSQVLVRMKAAGVNPADTYMRTGNYSVKPPLPYTPGSDGAGVIEAIGAGVSTVKSGDRVYVARSLTGTYAEYALTTESQVHPLPSGTSFQQGAGIYVPYGTAYRALHQMAHAKAGETLLVHGASGGVGIATVQIARAIGMTVIGTAGTVKGLELVTREGAHHVFNHHEPAYQQEITKFVGGRGVDVIVEMLANVNLSADMKMVATNGRIVIVGSRADATITPRDLMARTASIHGFVLWNVPADAELELHAGIIAGLENGTLRPVVGTELPLEQAAAAHKQVMDKGAFGKIVLLP
jgi:NADPH2:quinone reductase